jgi:hypothetical protein
MTALREPDKSYQPSVLDKYRPTSRDSSDTVTEILRLGKLHEKRTHVIRAMKMGTLWILEKTQKPKKKEMALS